MNNDATLSQPWYRHRWPWFLATGPVIVIIAGAITTWLAATGNTALVADDYYKQGLTINRTLERETRADELGVRVEVAVEPEGSDGTRLDVVLAMSDKTKYPQRLRVLLAHPTRSELDRELLLTGENGRYTGIVRNLAPTHWKLVVEDDARVWRHQGDLVIDASSVPGHNGG